MTETIVPTSKPWYKSKTVWLAILQLVVAFATALIALLKTGDTSMFFGSLILMAKSYGDIWLRYVTTSPMNEVILPPQTKKW